MAARQTLPKLVIASIFPLQTLRDVNPELHQDLENDLDQLLHWLQPKQHSGIEMSYAEPLPRTKVAAKRCLRTQPQQLDFMKLWINSIRLDLEGRLPKDLDLFTALDAVWQLRSFYVKQLSHMKLTNLANDSFCVACIRCSSTIFCSSICWISLNIMSGIRFSRASRYN